MYCFCTDDGIYFNQRKLLSAKGEYTMAKTANLYARIEPDVKEQAENILSALGIPVSNAINMFYKQIILQNGIPFDLKLPTHPNDISKMTKAEFHAELEKGYQDCVEGRVQPVDEAFAEIRKELGL
jgi:DNA-damage-inducible protein J